MYFENKVHEIQIGEKKIELTLWDTAGQEDFDRLRLVSYPDADVVIMCFSIDSPDSLENIVGSYKNFIHSVMIYSRNFHFLAIRIRNTYRRIGAYCVKVS